MSVPLYLIIHRNPQIETQVHELWTLRRGQMQGGARTRTRAYWVLYVRMRVRSDNAADGPLSTDQSHSFFLLRHTPIPTAITMAGRTMTGRKKSTLPCLWVRIRGENLASLGRIEIRSFS